MTNGLFDIGSYSSSARIIASVDKPVSMVRWNGDPSQSFAVSAPAD